MTMWQIIEQEETKKAGELLRFLQIDQNEWKHEWMKDICKLCLEYITLDGLEDAFRASQIPDQILDIAEKELNA